MRKIIAEKRWKKCRLEIIYKKEREKFKCNKSLAQMEHTGMVLMGFFLVSEFGVEKIG
jgi:hypothetical protein